MYSNTRTMYYLTHEEASLIRNLLNNERMQYRAEDLNGGAFYATIVSAIDAMEHPEKYQPTES